MTDTVCYRKYATVKKKSSPRITGEASTPMLTFPTNTKLFNAKEQSFSLLPPCGVCGVLSSLGSHLPRCDALSVVRCRVTICCRRGVSVVCAVFCVVGCCLSSLCCTSVHQSLVSRRWVRMGLCTQGSRRRDVPAASGRRGSAPQRPERTTTHETAPWLAQAQ